MGIFDDVFGGVIDFFHETIQGGGDILGDIVNPILDPIHHAIHDDPIKAIAQVAALTVSGGTYAWTLPLIEGADAVQNGADIEEVAKVVAISFVGQQVGSHVGAAAGEASKELLAPILPSYIPEAVATKAIEAGTTRAAMGVVYGEDPIEALKKGGVSAAIRAGIGTLQTNVPNYNDLPQAVRGVIETGLVSTMVKGEITPVDIASSLATSYATANIMKGWGEKLTEKGYSEVQQSIMTSTLNSALRAGFSGGNVGQVIQKSLIQTGFKALNDTVLDPTFDKIVDTLQGDYAAWEKTIEEYDSLNEQRNNSVTEYNDFATEYERLRVAHEDARINDERNATFDTRAARNNAAIAFNEFYEENNATMQSLLKNINKLNNEIGYPATTDVMQLPASGLTKELEDIKSRFRSNTDILSEQVQSIQNSAEEVLVHSMDNNFNVEDYKALNNFSDMSDSEAIHHWLTVGKDDNLYTNQESYNNAYDNIERDVINKALAATGLNLNDLSKKDREYIIETMDTTFESNIDKIKNANIEELGITFGRNYLKNNNVESFTLGGTLEGIKDAITELVGIPSADAQELYNIENQSPERQNSIAENNAIQTIDGWQSVKYEPVYNEFYGQHIVSNVSRDGDLFVYDVNGEEIAKYVLPTYTQFLTEFPDGYPEFVGIGNPLSIGAYKHYLVNEFGPKGLEIREPAELTTTFYITGTATGEGGIALTPGKGGEEDLGGYDDPNIDWNQPLVSFEPVKNTLTDLIENNPETAINLTENLPSNIKALIDENNPDIPLYDLIVTEAAKKQGVENVNVQELKDKIGLYYPGVNEETATLEDMESKIDPLIITEEESKDLINTALQGQGVENITPELIDALIESNSALLPNPLAELTEAQHKNTINDIINQEFVTLDEARQVFSDLGLSEISDEDLAAYVGQYKQADLESRAKEDLSKVAIPYVLERLEGLPVGMGEEYGEQIAAQDANIMDIYSAIGEPRTSVTDEHIKTVKSIISQDGAFTTGDNVLEYDVTGDGLVNNEDLSLLQTMQGDPYADFHPTGTFTHATGLYGNLESQNKGILDAMKAQEEAQKEEQEKQARAKAQQDKERADLETLRWRQGMMQTAIPYLLPPSQPGMVEIETPEPKFMEAPYDFSDILRPVEGEEFVNPYERRGVG